MADVFKKGDTVRLKSGGPILTVSNTGEHLDEFTIWCIWFEKTKRFEETFPPETLQKVSTARHPITFRF